MASSSSGESVPAAGGAQKHMLFRFCLYGFLKNQQYYEPFLILVFREKGLSFLDIGLLVGFREVCVNLFEIPSGAAADLYGRRRSMILSMAAYIASFVIFALSTTIPVLFGAMFCFAIGEAFRTGTHKAMIFDWLRFQGRTNERTKIYGYTRSWSKLGSAVSVLIAAGLVFYSGRYTSIFWFCIIPYLLNIINFLGYPKALDGACTSNFSLKVVTVMLVKTLRQALGDRPLRRLLGESFCFEGMFNVAKDYLQPVLRQAALALPVLTALADKRRAALLVGVVYFLLHLLSSQASRHSHRVVERWGGEEQAARFLWYLDWAIYASLVPLLLLRWNTVTIPVFICLSILQNFWRPLLMARLDSHSSPEQGATILSIESQAKSLGTMVLAPLLGWTVDQTAAGGGDRNFWPVATAGLVLASLVLVTGRLGKRPAA